MITLYDYELSGNCYKVRLFMSILNVAYQTEPVEFYPSREHKSEKFLKVNPLGQLPALRDGELVLRDAQAILVYLATQYDKTGYWYPIARPDLMAEVQMWMAFADGLTSTISAARLHDLFFFDFDAQACRHRAHDLLRILDEHLWFRDLKGLQYICSSLHPTIADIACFPYIALADEGGVSLEDYPAIRRWVDRVKRLPGFTVMSGVFPTSSALDSSAQQISA
ncbi:glutathione S-transferase (plasmid) [Pseudomonas putida]|uniref:glutathione S-transferase family protein n=1 Tax=Pseudomonas putida TaxID=303 RepID=UPI0018C980F6|nr:glutathione S-transferase [Pseudomonas putida]MDD2006451.1 glutathione S-transferase [Pseudomonas putida]QPN46287.1 glutathione S-transferase [Priestia aryabhattai]WVM70069.1 glutathione S-transferase [Pseudomonas putida]